ncbi:hypothetical protein CSOJ01_04562 [Colletotrichum sojae]|uniref:Uncharacterized protein n=1 Tax=Colletotrichum sojae TaxID=2175907 RepID=A0A8H6JJ48_9PEZI|nr:hypothetical protein CSOJ01_04562 [Colletotrichum sojae]
MVSYIVRARATPPGVSDQSKDPGIRDVIELATVTGKKAKRAALGSIHTARPRPTGVRNAAASLDFFAGLFGLVSLSSPLSPGYPKTSRTLPSQANRFKAGCDQLRPCLMLMSAAVKGGRAEAGLAERLNSADPVVGSEARKPPPDEMWAPSTPCGAGYYSARRCAHSPRTEEDRETTADGREDLAK